MVLPATRGISGGSPAGAEPVRIVHLSSLYPPASFGGAERVASLLAEAQAAAGHAVFATSLTRTPEPAGERHGVATMPLAGRNPLWIEDSARFPAPVRLANKAATVLNMVTAAQLGALLDRVRPDVLHTHSMVELPAATWGMAAARGVPVVHTLHDYDLLCIRAALFRNGRRCEARHLACRILSAPKQAQHRHIDVVAAVSRTVMDRHRDHGLFDHLPPERRHVVWNPVAPDSGPDPARHGAGGGQPARMAGAPFRFGYLGRLVAHKGLGVVLEACRRLPAAGWTLSVAGVGPEEPAFRRAAAGLPVEFLGHRPAAAFLHGIDVLVVVPIWDEPFGLTALEGYAAGRRVIGAAAGVTGEVVARVDPGWTVPPDDPAALAAAMIRAMQAPADGATQHARELLNGLRPDTVARTYVDLYEQAREVARRRG